MIVSNTKMATYTQLSQNCTKPRKNKIRKITIHHAAGNITLQGFGATFCGAREVSANYGIDSQGRVGMYVEECNRAWTSSSAENDNQAITIEIANDGGAPDWHVSDAALEAAINLCVDICKRNGIEKLSFTGDKNGSLTMHKYFAATGCPGPYLESKFPYIAEEVNRRLGVSAAIAYSKLSELVGSKSASITTVFKEKGSCWSSGWHNGVDIACAADTPIYAAADGVVVNADTTAHNDGYGNRVIIKHPDGKATLYAHMIAPAAVKVGQAVKRGQIIGKVGNTGKSYGAHLHFTLLDNWDKKPNIYYSGDLLDPVKILGLGTLKYADSAGASTSADNFKVGDTVNFIGTVHYASSTNSSGSACKPGKAKITRIADGTPHPYHLVNDGGGSTVYGWVNAEDVRSATKNIDETAREVIRGDWGNGDVRKKRLTEAGYDYNAVQKRVGELMK